MNQRKYTNLNRDLKQTINMKANKQGLTPRQKEVYTVIKEYIHANGFSPSYEELKQLLGSRSKSHVHAFVHQLARRGWIGFGNGRNRSIFIL
jgi:repressor LexA